MDKHLLFQEKHFLTYDDFIVSHGYCRSGLDHSLIMFNSFTCKELYKTLREMYSHSLQPTIGKIKVVKEYIFQFLASLMFRGGCRTKKELYLRVVSKERNSQRHLQGECIQ